jgi:cyclopropane fatty-acyl-phospholipid synthase-like methyltransferase
MLFDWNADTIRWYLDAEMYSGFYRRIAEAVAPGLDGYQTMCDLGCGLALFDFEVAPRFETVRCVDMNETALRSVRERAERLGLTNLVTRLDDCYHLTGAWDVVFMSFFGSRELDRFLPMCRKLVAVVSAVSDSELFPMKQRRYKKNTVDDTKKYLDEKGIGYKLTTMQLEFGQPFVSLDDARRCVRYYVPEITDAEAGDYLTNRLKETAGEVWPYYLPRMKSVGLFELAGTLR